MNLARFFLKGLEKGKGLNFRALGLRPFPGLGQKNVKKKKNGCFGVVR